MGAIAGIFWLDDCPGEVGSVNAMLTAIGHRGASPPRLVHRSSVVIGELFDKLNLAPSIDVEEMIVADARLDNAPELAKLVRSRRSATTQSVLLDAYKRWGAGCAQRLVGDFAVAIWDGQQQQLVCIRDQFGARPLFYCYIPNKLFAFGSEVKALLAITRAKRDQTAIADFLAWHHDAERTSYEGIRRLPPGHTLTVSRAGLTQHRYWAPDPTRTVRYASDAEYAEAFLELFTNAVRCRIEASAGLGAELSGGLDSSSVVCAARQLAPSAKTLSTFSLLVLDDQRYDERPFIDAVTSIDGLKAKYIDITEQSPLRHIECASRAMDGPAPGTIISDIWSLHAHAAHLSVDVMLDGCEGDLTLYYNFRYLSELARKLRLSTVLQEARDINQVCFHGSASWWWVLWRYCAPMLLPSWLSTPTIRRFTGMSMLGRSDTPQSLIRRQLAESTGVMERLEIERRKVNSLRSHREIHAHALMDPSLTIDMEVADHIGAIFAITHAHPFYDRRLIEFCLALPREQLICKGWTRPILRRALGDILPANISGRGDKVGIFAPRRLARLERPVLEETARDDETLGDYVDMNRLRNLTTRYLDGQARFADHALLWPALSLRSWLRTEPYP